MSPIVASPIGYSGVPLMPVISSGCGTILGKPKKDPTMRPALLLPVLLLPVLLLTLACSSKLERTRAEDLIRKDYPVVVPVTVPERASAEKGSPEHLRLVALKENLDKGGWFDSSRTSRYIPRPDKTMVERNRTL